MFRIFLVCILCLLMGTSTLVAQRLKWSKDGNSYFSAEGGDIVRYTLPDLKRQIIAGKEKLTPAGQSQALQVQNFAFSADNQKLLVYTNSKRVWRYDTRGDYWLLNLTTGKLSQFGKSMPASSLMFAKLSPNGNKVAYVSGHNIYTEDINSGKVTRLTSTGTSKVINGTFDWAYEEEFFCRDGFRWSPDSKQIAFWQIDATKVKDYFMMNNTDSVYPTLNPVEYPIAGEAPSPFKIGVVNVSGSPAKWMNIPTDPVLQSYVPRMEWADNSRELIIQHLNRKQNKSELQLCDAATGATQTIYTEQDSAWIDILPLWDEDYAYGGWDWLAAGKEFIWASEKDGWRHLYRISRDGKGETLITKGNFDVMDISAINEGSGYVYYFASPGNATQKYLYRSKLNGTGEPERLSPPDQPGTHDYDVSPGGSFALHKFSNYYTPGVSEWVSLPGHQAVSGSKVNEALTKSDRSKSAVEFFKIKTEEGVEMDAWMVKPQNFDPSKKYPVVFYVYTEPWGQNVKDVYNVANNHLYSGSMAADGYIYMSIDNRGTPVPKGRAWRKSIYRKIGQVNISDQAMAAKEVLKWPFVDSSRIAVWGWSGGGSATLNLMFQYPQIYKTGIAVAAVGSQFTYDNIYQERYMGLPQENKEDFIKGSPITYVPNFQGNLLYIHGTGDDNVHYQNAELLLNEMIKFNKQFQFMAYPNRTHGIFEGQGTTKHLSTLYTRYLKDHCAGGPR